MAEKQKPKKQRTTNDSSPVICGTDFRYGYDKSGHPSHVKMLLGFAVFRRGHAKGKVTYHAQQIMILRCTATTSGKLYLGSWRISYQEYRLARMEAEARCDTIAHGVRQVLSDVRRFPEAQRYPDDERILEYMLSTIPISQDIALT